MKRAAIIVLALTACSGQGTPGFAGQGVIQAIPAPAAAIRSSAQRVVYASDWIDDVVDVFSQTGSHQRLMQYAAPNLEPAGIATNRNGDAYVAEAAGNGVYIFALGSSLPVSGLNDAGNEPLAVAVDRTGNAYVANTYLLEFSGFVDYFPAGTTEPGYQIADPNFKQLYGLALDRHSNLYVSYVDPMGHGGVSKFAPGSRGPGDRLDLPKGLYFGLAFDKDENLVAANYSAGEIEVFPPGSAKPLLRFGHRGRPWSVAFNRSRNRLFVADFERNQIEQYAYPSGALIDTIQGEKGGAFVGVATSP